MVFTLEFMTPISLIKDHGMKSWMRNSAWRRRLRSLSAGVSLQLVRPHNSPIDVIELGEILEK